MKGIAGFHFEEYNKGTILSDVAAKPINIGDNM